MSHIARLISRSSPLDGPPDGPLDGPFGEGDPGPHPARRFPAVRHACRVVLGVHIRALWIWGGFLSLTALAYAWVHHLGRQAEEAGSTGCGRGTAVRAACLEVSEQAHRFFGSMLEYAAGVLYLLPFAVAMWAGAVLVAREFETGTTALAWTQSVSPARWLAGKTAVCAAVVTAGTAALTCLFRWAWYSVGEDRRPVWHGDDTFHAAGTAGLGYVLLGLAAGVFAGVLMRQALPAAVLAAVLLAVPYVALDEYRFDLWPTTKLTGVEATQNPHLAYQSDLGMLGAGGAELDAVACFDSESAASLRDCMAEFEAQEIYAVVHPASHFWPIQAVETGIVLALAALLTAAAFLLLRRRTP